MAGRHAMFQPAYDFLTGSDSPPRPARAAHNTAANAAASTAVNNAASQAFSAYEAPSQSLRQPLAAKPDHNNEALRAEIKALQYELSTLKQEQDLLVLRHEKELREAQTQAESDFKKAQVAEAERNALARNYDAVARELKDVRETAAADKAELERKLRIERERVQTLDEAADEVRSELAAHERQAAQKLHEQQRRNETLQQTSDELRRELTDKCGALRDAQQRLARAEAAVGELESAALQLKARAGDADALAVTKRELTEQMAHIRRLEQAQREQQAELRQHRQLARSVELVEEEKRAALAKLARMDELRAELTEVRHHNQILEDERKAWTLYLRNDAATATGEGGNENGDVNGIGRFDSPADMARALAQERLAKAALVERLGALQPEVSERDEIIKSLEANINRLKAEIEKLRASSGSQTGIRSRLERQKALALKEIDFLRTQLKTFDAEETTFQPEMFDEQKTRRVQELEALLDQYRAEIQSLNEQLFKKEENSGVQPRPAPAAASSAPHKRPRDNEADERLGVLSRKNRALQDEISKLQQAIGMLRKERDVLQAQVEALQASGRTRILQLRSNPASEAAAIKQATLNALRAENADLLAQLENKRYASPDATDAAAAAAAAADDDKDNGHHFVNKGNNSSSSSSNNNRSRRDVRLVPLSTLENVRQQVRDTERLVAERDKRMRRLKQAWEVQSLEFRKAVASILGWKVDFLPDGHGRVRVTPMFYADAASRRRNARRKRKTGGGAGGAGSRSGDNDDDDDDDDDDNDDDDGEEGGAGGEDDKSKYSIVFDREKNSVHVTGAPDGEFAREIQPLVRFWLDQRDDIPCFLAAATLEYYDRTTRATRAASAGAAST